MNDDWLTTYKTIVNMEMFTDKEKQELYNRILNEVLDLPVAVSYEDPPPKRKTPAQLRKEHPSLQDAWEQYQLVLKLIRAGEDMQEDEHE